MQDDRNEAASSYDITPVVPPGALQEHLTPAGAAEISRTMRPGEKRIYPRCSLYTLRGDTCLRIDRVKAGFLIYYGMHKDLRAIAPQFP